MQRGGVWAGAGAVAGLVVLLATVCLTSACAGLGYYAQAAAGHLDLVARAQPVEAVAAAASTPPGLRERLLLSQRMRDFAVRELALPDNRSYRYYADLGRSAAVWNVVAAPALSLTLETWCFPVVGCVGYRGYYEHAAAEASAEQLRARGLEVAVYGVPAYSTLGKLDWLGGDPLLNTFINGPEGDLARLVFHELAHQVVYAPGDTMFNESFASAVERLGTARWLAQHASAAARAESEALETRRTEFRQLTAHYRERLDALYRSAASQADKQQQKAALMQALRADHARLKAERWQGFAGYDAWLAKANNAALGVLAAYTEWVPNFERLFEREGRDFRRFYAAVQRLADLPRTEREAALRAL